MKDFPSCFGENGVQIADSSSNTSKTAQNLVTCVYQSKLHGRSCLINITWSKHLMGQGLSVGIDDLTKQCLCKVDIKPWLFSKRKGCKSIEVDKKSKVNIFWDLSLAKFGSGPEPLEGFYVAIVFGREMVLLLGNLIKEAYKKTSLVPNPSNGALIAKREHIFGKKVYCTKAKFCDNGQIHDVLIECDNVGGHRDPCLMIRIDSAIVLQVKRLKWKFRGNQTILVDGFHVEVFWDVHNWLFGVLGNAVFMFQSYLSAEKSWVNNSSPNSDIMPWSCSETFRDSQLQGLGFSLILYAWKNEFSLFLFFWDYWPG